MSEMKRKVLEALVKSMHGMMKAGAADSAMGKSGLSDALDEAKEEAKEDPKEEASESPTEEKAEDVMEPEAKPDMKKKKISTISIMAIRKGSMPSPAFKKK